MDTLKDYLSGLGATKVLTLEDLQEKEKFRDIKSLLQDSPVRLALNCVSGPSVASFASLLGKDSHLVTYGTHASATSIIEKTA